MFPSPKPSDNLEYDLWLVEAGFMLPQVVFLVCPSPPPLLRELMASATCSPGSVANPALSTEEAYKPPPVLAVRDGCA